MVSVAVWGQLLPIFEPWCEVLPNRCKNWTKAVLWFRKTSGWDDILRTSGRPLPTHTGAGATYPLVHVQDLLWLEHTRPRRGIEPALDDRDELGWRPWLVCGDCGLRPVRDLGISGVSPNSPLTRWNHSTRRTASRSIRSVWSHSKDTAEITTRTH